VKTRYLSGKKTYSENIFIRNVFSAFNSGTSMANAQSCATKLAPAPRFYRLDMLKPVEVIYNAVGVTGR